MFSTITFTFSKYRQMVLILGLAYSATLVFPAFGPALKVSVSSNVSLMSTLAFLSYVVGFSVPYGKFVKPKFIPKYYLGIMVGYAPFILFFDILPHFIQWGIIGLFSVLAGRIGCIWTQYFQSIVPNNDRGKVASLSIGLTFFILYICTIVIEFLPVRFTLAIPVCLSLGALYLLSHLHETHNAPAFKRVSQGSKKVTWHLYALFVIIYISGGFTYAGLFPKFEPYIFISKYYNVQPLFLTIIFAGLLADTFGRKNMLYIGFGFVGVSFSIFMMPASYTNYLLTQTFTQIGWGFINTYVWVTSADIAERTNRPMVASYGVAAMLLGTVIGALLTNIFHTLGLAHGPLYSFASHVPLFIGLIFVGLIPETLEKYRFTNNSVSAVESHEMLEIMPQEPSVLDCLTTREREVAELILQDYSRSEICDTLNISINTLKTHIRHIYKKLEVNNKNALKLLVHETQYTP